jgi:hypothetical protein
MTSVRSSLRSDYASNMAPSKFRSARDGTRGGGVAEDDADDIESLLGSSGRGPPRPGTAPASGAALRLPAPGRNAPSTLAGLRLRAREALDPARNAGHHMGRGISSEDMARVVRA